MHEEFLVKGVRGVAMPVLKIARGKMEDGSNGPELSWGRR
jgi:hypothetical protein